MYISICVCARQKKTGGGQSSAAGTSNREMRSHAKAFNSTKWRTLLPTQEVVKVKTKPGPIMLLVLLMLNSSALHQICQPNFRDNM